MKAMVSVHEEIESQVSEEVIEEDIVTNFPAKWPSPSRRFSTRKLSGVLQDSSIPD